jgi:hypothetical protein
LNNQSNQRAEAGDRAGALAAIDEAVSAYRELAAANPAVFLPDLAMSLNNQSNQRAEAGDRAGALAAIDEAVAIRRELAVQHPITFASDLVRSTRLLANQLATGIQPSAAIQAWKATIAAIDAPAPRGEARAAMAGWLGEHGDLDGQASALRLAADEVIRESPGQPAFAVGRARQAIRGRSGRRTRSWPCSPNPTSRSPNSTSRSCN